MAKRTKNSEVFKRLIRGILWRIYLKGQL